MKKIKTILEIEKIVIKLKRQKKKVVLSHGVFDLVHLGHIEHFKQAKKKGDKLIVSITSSTYVNKGPGKPIFNDHQRAAFLESIDCIDYVIINYEETSTNLIKKIKPSIYCKGPDYSKEDDDITKNILLEKKAIQSYGGRIVYTTGKTFSSSNLINNYYISKEKTKKQNLINQLKKKYTFSDLKEIFQSFFNLKVLVVGDLIIDQYNFCRAIGKSGKEPMMVFKDLHKINFLGGAGYVARNLSSFCKKIDLVSIIGKEVKLNQFIRKNLDKNINVNFVKSEKINTIIKKRYVDEISNFKMLGVYKYSDNYPQSVKSQFYKKIIKLKKYDLVLVTDFGHGVIDNKIIKCLKKNNKYIVANSQLNAINKGYQELSKLKNVDTIVMNESELRFEQKDQSSKIEKLMIKLKKNLKIKNLVVTRGSEGVVSLNSKNYFNYCDAMTKSIVDKVGSGDCLMSTVSLFYSKKYDDSLALLSGSLAAAQSIENFGVKKIINKSKILKSLEHIIK